MAAGEQRDSITQGKWTLVGVVVVASVATTLATIRILTPVERQPVHVAASDSANVESLAEARVQSERLTRVERELSLLIDQVQSAKSGQQQPATTVKYAERIKDLEQQLANLQRAEQVKAQEKAALQSALNDPAMREKYNKYAQRQNERQRAQLAEVFHSQAPDPDWAPEMIAHITNAFTAPGVQGAQLSNADCRETICRVEYHVSGSSVSGDDPTAFMELEHNLIAGFAAGGDVRLNMKARPDQFGGYEYTVYVVKKDAQLPRAPSELDGLSMIEAIERLRHSE